jgi:tRNA pseudouridine55 synthase
LAKNKKGREINGIVLLDKDTGLSSNAALQKVKASLYKGCPSFLSAEYIGGTCSISP